MKETITRSPSNKIGALIVLKTNSSDMLFLGINVLEHEALTLFKESNDTWNKKWKKRVDILKEREKGKNIHHRREKFL